MLRVDDRKGRSRSKSPGRGRERSRSHVREPSPGPQYYTSAGHGGSTPQYEVRQPGQPSSTVGSEPVTMGGYTDLPPEERPGYIQQAQHAAQYQSAAMPNVQYAQTGQYGYTAAPANQPGPPRNPSAGGGFQYAAAPDKITFTAKPVVPTAQPPPVRHVSHNGQSGSSPYQQQVQYTSMPHAPPPPHATAGGPPPPPPAMGRQHPPPAPIDHSRAPDHHRVASYSGPAGTYDGRKLVEMVPQGGGKLNAPPSPGMRPHSLSVSGRPDGLGPRMERLSVSGNRPDMHGMMSGGMPGGLPPPSPLLEAYTGVYQSISPLPQAKMLPDDDLDMLSPLDPLSPRGSNAGFLDHHRTQSHSRQSPSPQRRIYKDKLAMEAYGGGIGSARDHAREKPKERRVKIQEMEDDALDLVDALAGRTVRNEVLIDILPALTHDQMLDLRSEYKRHCKVQGRGINISKHIKMKTTGNFGKVAYVTALGRYESEGYWANYWYQSGNAKRELLIEALMGRSNDEIHEIKDAFRDKRYGDSLTRCMDKELKADKFRKAVLMALEGERQEERDVWEIEYRNRDVETLHKALVAREGGESTMLGIVVRRSDAHLREVLRTYERMYGNSFARDALRKSNNLVGEVIAHILNGVINRPARDALLLHHALMDLIEPAYNDGPRSSSKRAPEASSSKHERQQRYELLISRLVRLHWDRLHLSRVKMEYEEKYGRVIEEDIAEATKSDFRDFCLALCQTGR